MLIPAQISLTPQSLPDRQGFSSKIASKRYLFQEIIPKKEYDDLRQKSPLKLKLFLAKKEARAKHSIPLAKNERIKIPHQQQRKQNERSNKINQIKIQKHLKKNNFLLQSKNRLNHRKQSQKESRIIS